MCSNTLGPAIEPSLLTWPMTNTVMPCPFASCIRAMVQSFTCPTPPAGESISSLYSVWMESTMSTSGFSSRTHSVTFPKHVSDKTYRFSLSTRSRCARSFSWWVDSSPETYSTLENSPNFLQIWSISVDLPIPGAPPTKTSDPLTAPPPKTRSSSPIPVRKRISSEVPSSVMRSAFTVVEKTDFLPLFTGLSVCSTMVFHAPQAGQRPDHLGVSLPHSVQKKTVFAFMDIPLFFVNDSQNSSIRPQWPPPDASAAPAVGAAAPRGS